MCVRREFALWSANRSSPIIDWLRALARRAHKECGGRGVGAIGLCLTGGFAIAMMTEPKVIAPALAEPSLPLPVTSANRAAIDASEHEIACARQRLRDEDLTMIGLRFRGDPLVPSMRFETLKREFGDRFEAIELDPANADPKAPRPAHAVLTLHLNDSDPEGPTRKAEAHVIELSQRARCRLKTRSVSQTLSVPCGATTGTSAVACKAPPACAVGLAFALDDAAPSFHRRCSGFATITSGSAP
jgi:dienelactone hydrolase